MVLKEYMPTPDVKNKDAAHQRTSVLYAVASPNDLAGKQMIWIPSIHVLQGIEDKALPY